jgi:hypothetical protein
LIELMVVRNQRSARNMQAFAEGLVNVSGLSTELIAAWAKENQGREDLLAYTLEVAFTARSRRKIDGLAKLVSDNLHDDAKLDLSQMVVAALEQLENPHISVLHVFVHENPGSSELDGVRTWHCAALKKRLPGLADGIMPLVAALFRQGMITESSESEKDGLAWESTRFGITCLNYLE